MPVRILCVVGARPNFMIPPPAGGGAAKGWKSYVYLLKSHKDGTWYLGWMTDMLRRLVEHNSGQVGWTRRKAPWRVVGFERYQTAEEAKARERALKRSPRMLQLFKKRVLNRAATGRPRQVVG